MKMSQPSILHALIFCSITHLCFSQTNEIDSLQNLLETANDTTRVNTLKELGRKFRFQNKEMAIKYGLQSLEEAKEINFTLGEIKALYDIGLTYGMTGDYATSLKYFNKAQSLALEHGNFQIVLDTYNSLGIVYKRIGDYPTRQSYYLKSIKLIDSLNLGLDVSPIYVNLGVLHYQMGQDKQAVDNFEKALELVPESNREEREHFVLVNLAVLDYQNGDYEVALNKFLKAVPYSKERNDNISLCTKYSNIGSCYLNLGQWA